MLIQTRLSRTFSMFCIFVASIALFTAISVTYAFADDVWDGTTASSFESGSGGKDDPFIIETGAQLKYLQTLVADSDSQSAYNTSSVYYKITDNIYLNTSAVTADMVNINTSGVSGVTGYSGTLREWVPIGGAAGSFSFKGHLDGNGHSIYNIFYNHSGGTYTTGINERNNAGFIGKLEEGASVENLKLVGGYFGGQRSIGAVVGKSWGTISNCENSGVYVYANQSKGVGGIVGANWLNTSTSTPPLVKNCKNSGIVFSGYSTGSAGGTAGENEGTIVNCENSGIVYSRYNAGGLVGSNKSTGNKGTLALNSLIINSFNNGNVGACPSVKPVNETASASATYAGGIVAYQAYSARNCYSVGTITGTYAGQLIGQISSTATNDYLYYLSGSAVGTGTSSITANTFSSGAALKTLLNTNQSALSGYSLALSTWLCGEDDYYPHF
jgi:hypothetical protein